MSSAINDGEPDLLDNAIEESTGGIVSRRVEAVRRTTEAWVGFSRMFEDLLEVCETRDEVAVELMRNVGDRRMQEELHRSLDQSFLAYAAATGAVVEQLRTLVRSVAPEVGEEYSRKVATASGVEGAPFLTKARNYLLHYLAAPWTFEVEVDGASARAKVMLDVDALLDNTQWDAAVRVFLAGHADGLHLLPLLAPYRKWNVDLIEWTLDACLKANSTAIAETNALIARRNLILSGGLTDGLDWEERVHHMAENMRRNERGEPPTDFQTRQPLGN